MGHLLTFNWANFAKLHLPKYLKLLTQKKKKKSNAQHKGLLNYLIKHQYFWCSHQENVFIDLINWTWRRAFCAVPNVCGPRERTVVYFTFFFLIWCNGGTHLDSTQKPISPFNGHACPCLPVEPTIHAIRVNILGTDNEIPDDNPALWQLCLLNTRENACLCPCPSFQQSSTEPLVYSKVPLTIGSMLWPITGTRDLLISLCEQGEECAVTLLVLWISVQRNSNDLEKNKEKLKEKN